MRLARFIRKRTIVLKYRLSMDDLWKTSIKSKAKFSGDYKEELKKLVDLLDRTFEEKTDWGRFRIDSAAASRTNVRLRISDAEFGDELIVNCVLWYHHTDEKFGYVNVDLVTTGFSKKPETLFVGKFSITDHEAILGKICHDLPSAVKF